MEYVDRGVLPGSVIYRHSPSAAARKLYFYPIFVGHYFCSGEYKVVRSRFDSYLLMYVRRGSGYVSCHDRTEYVTAGDLILIDCYSPHCYGAGKQGWEIQWVHYDGPMAAAYYAYIEQKRQLIRPCAHTPVSHRLGELQACYEDVGAVEEAVLSFMLTGLLTELLLPLQETAEQPQWAVAEETMQYISQNLDRELTVEELAEHVSFSTFHFIRIFKEETGFTPHQYLLAARMDYARYLLRSGEQTIQDIAGRCGFQSAANFCTCFKKAIGQTPGAYRRGK